MLHFSRLLAVYPVRWKYQALCSYATLNKAADEQFQVKECGSTQISVLLEKSPVATVLQDVPIF
jgi:hypothetical protein